MTGRRFRSGASRARGPSAGKPCDPEAGVQINTYTILLLLSAAVAGALALYTWRRRPEPAGAGFALLMLATAVWALFYFFEGAATSLVAKEVFSVLSYLGSMSTPVLFFLFAVRYTQQNGWLTRRRQALLWVIPVVSIVMAATNTWHRLLWPSVTLVKTWAGASAVYAHGPWYWVEIGYGYLLLVVGFGVLLWAAWRLPQFFSRQARAMLVAALFPWAGNIIYTLSPGTVAGLDLTPIAFTLSSVLLAFAVFRYHLLDIRPIARNVFFEGILDPMLALDGAGRIVDANPAAANLLGLGANRLVGRPAVDVLATWSRFAPRLEGEEPEQRFEMELPVAGSAVSRYYDCHLRPLRDSGARQVGRLVTLHDITDLKRAEAELRHINAELDWFAHSVSHDLKTPIIAIYMEADLLERLAEGTGRPDIMDVISAISRNAWKACDRVGQLLRLAESGIEPTAVLDVDVGSVIGDVLGELAEEITARGAVVEVALDLGVLRADATQVYQVFANLIGNAIKHCDSDGPLVQISRLADSVEGGHRFLVRDNGSGIPTDELDRIFVPFQKGKLTGETGIGLAIVRKVTEAYRGSVRAYNEDGACFEITMRDWAEEMNRGSDPDFDN